MNFLFRKPRINRRTRQRALFMAAASLALSGLARGATLADWTFETSSPSSAGPYAADIGSGMASGMHTMVASSYSSPVGNGSLKSFAATDWTVGDYWQFSVATTNVSNIQFSVDQGGSNTGPRDFQLEYSTDGTTFTNFGSLGTVALVAWNNTTPNAAFTRSYDLSSISALNNQSSNPVYFRLVDMDTTSISGGTVATGGTDRIDNVTISGSMLAVKANNTNALDGGSSWVSGTAPGTGDIARWDNTVTGANTSSLNSSATWGEIQILNPGGTVGINGTGALTLGGVVGTGIDMSAAQQDLTISNNLTAGGTQIWNVASGRTLSLGGTVTGGSFGVTVQGGGTVALTNADSFANSLTVNNSLLTQTGRTLSAGTLNLNAGKISITSTSLTLTNTFTSTVLQGGASQITSTAGAQADNIFLGSITNSTGATLSLLESGGIITTTTSNGNSIIGGFATLNQTDFVQANGNGSNVTAPTYTTNSWPGSTNTTVTSSNAPASNSSTNSLRFNTAASTTVTLSGTNVISSGGILVTPNVGNFSSTITGGILEAGVGVSVFAHNYDTSNALTISSQISDNSGVPAALVKAGPGTVILGGTSTFTGGIYVNAGTLRLTHDFGLATNALNIASGGTFDLSNARAHFSALTGSGTLTGSGGLSQCLVSFNGNQTFSGSITGGAELDLNNTGGTGTLTLNGSDTSTGNVNIYGGTLTMGPSATLSSSNFVYVTGSGTFNLNNTNQTIKGLTSDSSSATVSLGSGTLTMNALSGSGTVAALISGTGGLVMNGVSDAAMTLTHANTYSGGTSVNGGTVTATNVSALGSGGLTVASAGTLNANWSGAGTIGGAVTNSGTFNVAAGATLGLTNSSFTQSAGALSVNGTLKMSGGTFNNNGGTIGGTVTLDNSSGSAPTLSLGAGAISGSFLFTGTSTSSPGWSLSGASVPAGVSLTVTPTNSTGGAYPLTTSGNLANAGTITLNGNFAQGGGLSLGNLSTNTLTNTGTLAINTYTGNNTGYGALYGGLTNSGTTTVGAVQTVISGTVSNSGTFTIAAGGDVTLGNGSAFTQSAGTTTLNGSFSNNGGFTIGGGTLTGTGTSYSTVSLTSGILTSGATASSTTGTLTLPGVQMTGGSLQFDIGTSTSNTIVVNGSVSFNGGNVSLLLGGTPAPGTQFTVLSSSFNLPTTGIALTPAVFGRTTLTPSISSHSLIVTASTTSLPLTWNNTGASGNGATWDVQNNQNWSSSGSPSTFFQGDSVTFNDSNNGHYAVTLNTSVSPASTTFANNSGNYTISGSGSIGGGGITLTGSKQVTLSTVNTYSGATTVNGGTLVAGISGAISPNSYLQVGASGTVDLAGYSQSFVSLSGSTSAVVKNSSATPATLTLNVPSGGEANAAYNGVISGPLSLVVNNDHSAQSLGGQSTYTGSTTINGGTLYTAVSNAIPTTSAVTVNGPTGVLNLGGNQQSVASLSGDGTVVLSSGTLIVTDSASHTFSGSIGGGSGGLTMAGTGTFTLSGNSNFTGPLTVNSGTLQLAANMTPGSISIGSATGATLNQTAGTATVFGNLSIASSASTSGAYFLSSGSLSAVTEYIGNGGTGIFTQTGGMNNTQALFVAAQVADPKPSIYNLSGGSLIVSGVPTSNLYVGDFNFGIFNQTGGSVSISTGLYLGRSADGYGIYNLSGVGTALSASLESIGGFGVGALTQLDGSNTVTGQLAVGSPNFNGTYDMQGGTISTGSLLDWGAMTQHLSAGAVTVSSSTEISNGGTYALGAGSFTTHNLYVGGNATASSGTGALTMTGGAATITGSSTVWSGGTLAINGGVFNLTGGGTLTSATPVQIGLGGILQVDNTSINLSSRIGDSTAIELHGGTFSYLGANTASTETLGALKVVSGASTVSLVNGTSGSTAVTFSALDVSARQGGATVNFSASGIGSTNKIFLTSQALGFIAGWATVDNGPLGGGDANFAKYVLGASPNGVVPMTGADYTSSLSAGGHVRLTGPISTSLTGPTSISTLSMDARNGTVTVAQAGNALTLTQGGLLALGSNQNLLTGGTLTTGRSDGEIDTYVQGSGNLEIDSQIVDPSMSTATSLVKSGPGLLTLAGSSPNTYTGTTYVHQGELDLNKSGVNAINGPLVITGGTLVQLQPGQLGPNTSMNVTSGIVTLGPTTNSIGAYNITGGQLSTAGQWSVTTATLGGGQTITLNGSVWTIGPTNPLVKPLTTTDQPVLIMSGGTSKFGAGTTTIVLGSTSFTGSSASTIQLDAGSNSVNPGVSGSPAGAGLLKLQGDVTVGNAGVDGILTGTVGNNQTPGTVDLNGVMRGFSVSTGSTLMISARVTDGGLKLSGGGIVQLMGANNYSMGTTLSQTTLLVSDPSALGSSSGVVSFSNGATLQLRSADSASSMTLPQPLSTTAGGSIGLDLGPLNQSNTTPCAFTSGAGTLGVALNVTGTAGDSLTLPSLVLQNTSANPTSIDNTVDLTVNGAITMGVSATNGDLKKVDTGNLTFAGNSVNSYTGTTRVEGGTLILNKSANVVAIPHDLMIFSGASVKLMADGQIDPSSHVTINSVSPATLDLNGHNNTIGNVNGTTFLAFSGGGTLSTGAGKATLGGDVQSTGTSGTAIISGNLGLGAANRTFSIAHGTSSTVDMQISANISGGPASGTAFTKTGPGILTLTGTNTYTGDTLVSGGTENVNGTIPATTNLTVTSSSTVNFGANPGSGILARTVAGITASTSGKIVVADPAGAIHTNRTVLVTGGLNLTKVSNNWTGLVNLNGNDMIVRNGTLSNIADQLKVGLNKSAGYWNGSAGIISTTAANNATHLTTLGYRMSDGSAFDGVNTTTSDVLVKYTYYGDSDLNGVVNGADYAQIDTGFGMHLTGWSNGDFNNDGVIDGTDYSLIDNLFNQYSATGASPLAIVAIPADVIAAPAPMFTTTSAVPEPTSLGLIGIGAAGLMTRRRRGVNIRKSAR